jgi:aerobic carbon-monoxide dehydrogenase medium subunit
MLLGQKPSLELIKAAAAEAPKIASPNADQRGSSEYKKDMTRVLVGRGITEALQRLGVNA